MIDHKNFGVLFGKEQPEGLSIQIKESVALKRLIDEVRLDKESSIGKYNRVYHRHNR
jgi:hypothetical protein